MFSKSPAFTHANLPGYSIHDELIDIGLTPYGALKFPSRIFRSTCVNWTRLVRSILANGQIWSCWKQTHSKISETQERLLAFFYKDEWLKRDRIQRKMEDLKTGSPH